MGLAKWRGHMAAPDVLLLYMHSSSKTTSSATLESMPSVGDQTTASCTPWWISGGLFWNDPSYFQATPYCCLQQLWRLKSLVYLLLNFGQRAANLKSALQQESLDLGESRHLHICTSAQQSALEQEQIPNSCWRCFIAAKCLNCLWKRIHVIQI